MARQYKDYDSEKKKRDLARIEGYLNNPKLSPEDKEILTEYLAYHKSRDAGSEKQVRKLEMDEKEVIELRKYGWNIQEIADRFGTEYRIVKGICQKHGVSKFLSV